MLKVVVLISGGGSNLKALLDATAEKTYPARIVAVGSDTDASGLDFARQAGVPTFIVRPKDFASREEWGQALSSAIKPHLGLDGLVVSAGFMRILPPSVVRDFSPRLINTHPALLPHFPGAHAVRDALAAGVDTTGVSVHIIDEGVDTGRVLRQAQVNIGPGETEEEVHERIKVLERPLLVETVRQIASAELDLNSETTRSATSAAKQHRSN